MARGRYELEPVVEEGFPATLLGGTGQELTRIVQEALTNVHRHAEARHVRVKLGIEGEDACVEVANDGHGFDPESPKLGIGRHSSRGAGVGRRARDRE